MKTSSNNSRRAFLKTSAMAGTLLLSGISAFSNVFKGSGFTEESTNPPTSLSTGFDQEALPYGYIALEPIIDATTMEIHYSKHAAAYSKNLKEAAIAEKANMQAPLEELLANISNYSMKMRNNGGGHYNHEMFWKCMQPARSNNLPNGPLLSAIEKQFGSFENFKTIFSEAAKTRFGSGWAWLYTNTSGELKIGSTSNQDNPLMNIASIEHKGFPLLCLDVWEHAYYLKYQNRRIEYIQNWWNLVNWSYVEKRFETVK
jgi:Fe-Mn family superoxide dismutase